MALINPSIEQFNDSLVFTDDEQLRHDFNFDLGNHELIDPGTNRGMVTSIEQVDSISASGAMLPCDVYDISVRDPFVAADPEGYSIVSDYIAGIEDSMLKRGYNPLDGRTEAGSEMEHNMFTQAWLNNPNIRALRAWRELVPTALALDHLTNPWAGSIITGKDSGVGDIVSREASAQLRFVEDAIAIRNRAIAMEQLATKHLSGLENDRPVRWLSLASGTAEPAIAAAKTASETADLDISLTVADYDKAALRLVKQNAAAHGFAGNVQTVCANILKHDLREKLESKTGNAELYDVVENMGFEEYLPQDGDEIEAYKGQGLPQASEFTKNAFDLVRPGGVLISGNMVLNRPQIGFVFGIVDWPVINARSEESILRVYKEAGILDNPNASLELYRVKDDITGAHVYDIVKVTKLR